MNPQLIYQLRIGRQDPIPVKNGINYNNNNELEKWVSKKEMHEFFITPWNSSYDLWHDE